MKAVVFLVLLLAGVALSTDAPTTLPTIDPTAVPSNGPTTAAPSNGPTTASPTTDTPKPTTEAPKPTTAAPTQSPAPQAQGGKVVEVLLNIAPSTWTPTLQKSFEDAVKAAVPANLSSALLFLGNSSAPIPAPTAAPTTAAPTTVAPTTAAPTTVAPTTVAPTTVAPTTVAPTTVAPTTVAPTTVAPTTVAPTTVAPTTAPPQTTQGPGARRLLQVRGSEGILQRIALSSLPDGETNSFALLEDSIKKANATTLAQFNIVSISVVNNGSGDNGSGSSGLSGGAIAGIVIGVLVLVLILAFCFVRVQKNQSDESDAKYTSYNQSGGV